MATVSTDKLKEVAKRIREMREICDITETDMAKKTEVSLEDYRAYENGELDFPFTFIHKCSLAFGIGITDLLEGQSAHLSSYTVTRKGQGQETAKEDGIEIQNLAPLFRKKMAFSRNSSSFSVKVLSLCKKSSVKSSFKQNCKRIFASFFISFSSASGKFFLAKS